MPFLLHDAVAEGDVLLSVHQRHHLHLQPAIHRHYPTSSSATTQCVAKILDFDGDGQATVPSHAGHAGHANIPWCPCKPTAS